MKRTLVFFLCALGPVLPAPNLANAAPNLADAPPPTVPSGPVIEVTEGYGSAKWGMSVADFEKVYPEATLDYEIPENVTNQQSGQKFYSLGNDSLRLSFTFLRGQLVKIVLHTPPPFSPYPGPVAVPRNLRPMEQRIEERFVAQKNSGVSIRVQMTYSNYMLPPGMPQRRALANGGRPAQPVAVQRSNSAPIAVQPGAPQALPGVPQQPQPAMPQPPQPIMEISLSQLKLAESLEENFTKEIATAQNRAVEDFIAKLAPPK